jgi:hypothetical protein
MSQAHQEFPMPALAALGQEFERLAAAPRPVRSRLPVVAPWKVAMSAVATTLAVFLLATSPGQALARHIGELFGVTQEQRLLEPICGYSSPCVIVNGAAGTGPALVTGTNLLKEARPASECPEAAAAYLAAGVLVNAFLGRCPDPADLPKAPPGAAAGPRIGGSGVDGESRRERFLRSIGAPTDRP